MAYSFDRTMAALGQLPSQDEPDSSQNQSNVLAPQQGRAQNFSGSIPTDTITATSSAGDLSGSGSSSEATPSRSPDSPNVNNTSAGNSLLTKNAGRVSAPIDVQGLQNNIAGAKSSLQNEANNYVTGAGDLFGGGKISDAYQGQINQFVKNGLTPTQSIAEPVPTGSGPSGFDAYQAAAKSQAPYQSAAPVDFTDLYKTGATQVNPLTINTNTNFDQASLLGTDAGLQNLFRQNNDPEYNSGSAALDTALLTRTPGFNQQRDQVTQANQDLLDYKNQVQTNAPTYAQETRDAAQKAWKTNVNAALDAGLAGIKGSGQSQADDFIKQLGLNNPVTAGQAAATNNGWRGGLNTATGQVESVSGVDPTSYVKQNIDPTKVGWQDFLSSDQANAYNAINGLEGNGVSALAGAGKYAPTVNSDGSTTAYDAKNGLVFDQAGYQAAAQDAAVQKAKDAQMAAAAQAAAQTKAEQNSPFPNGTYTDNAGQHYDPSDPYGVFPGDSPIPNYHGDGANTDAPSRYNGWGVLSGINNIFRKGPTFF